MTDLRTLSPGQKCVSAGKHASLCGNIVVLRSTRVHAEGTKKVDTEDLLKQVTDKWDAIDDKPQFLLYSGAALVALYFVNSIVSSVNNIPFLPGLMETVGIGYSTYFA